MAANGPPAKLQKTEADQAKKVGGQQGAQRRLGEWWA